MKSQRRHELKENVLGSELGKTVEFLKKRGSWIAWGILIAALIALISVYAYKKHRAALYGPLAEYNAVRNSRLEPAERMERLEALADQDKNTRIAALASIAYADECAEQALLGGAELPEIDKKSLLEKAGGYYRRVIGDFSDMPVMVARARLGLGKLAESRGDFEAARQEYEAVMRMTKLANHPLASHAKDCLDSLKRLASPAPMAASTPAEPASAPAENATAPAATQAEPASKPAGENQ